MAISLKLSRLIVSLALLAMWALVAMPLTFAQDPQIPVPEPLPPTGIDWKDNIYFGAVPENHKSDVYVFVHGMGRFAEDWWQGENDMYETVYNAGYRTAFVTLDYPREEPANSIWVNGERFSLQVEFIAEYYGVSRVQVIAHSKGGIDTQVAVAYHDSWQFIDNVLTIASPHQGSELAEWAFTNPVVYALLEQMGVIGQGLEDIRPANMQNFRALTDPLPENGLVNYYTAAGTEYDQFPLTIFGAYLSQFGPNDGFVTVASTHLPYAPELFLKPYHHFNIYYGHAFGPFEAVVLGNTAGALYLPSV